MLMSDEVLFREQGASWRWRYSVQNGQGALNVIHSPLSG